MDKEAVNELVVYLAHCNRKEHLTTVLDMVRQQAANTQALKDASSDLSGMLAEYRRARREMFEKHTAFDPLMERPYAGR